MNRRLFLWGLANGAIMLALGGAFWIGLGVGMLAPQVHWSIPAMGTLIEVAGAFLLIRASLRLRRRSDFQRSELRRPEGVTPGQQRYIRRGFIVTTIAQGLLGGLLVWVCVRSNAEHLIWPSLGAVVSLHFAPLGRLFHVRTYYATGLAGAIVSAVGFAVAGTPAGIAALGVALCAVMWGSSAHVLANADRIADQACTETWASI